MIDTTQVRKIFRFVTLSLIAGTALGLAGCAMGGYQVSPSDTQTGDVKPGGALQGMVHGGQNPISGSKVYLYAAGNSAAAHTYGTGATSLLTDAVLTNNTSATDAASDTGVGAIDGSGNYYIQTGSGGYFNLSNDYSCPAAVNGYAAELYVVVLGGDSGGGSNPDIALMAALGACPAGTTLAGSIPFVVVNELTTVAAVWALQQFMAPPTSTPGVIDIGAPTTNLVGLQNAFTTAANLVDISQGAAPATIGTATPESDKILLLGNILAHCVNSPSPVTANCNDLFASVTPAGTALSTKSVLASSLTAPADTAAAAWYLAQFPNSVGGATCGDSGGAYQCSSGIGAAFTTTIAAEPNDWTLAVGYAPTYLAGTKTTAAIAEPFGVALDFYGNAWLTNTGTNSVTMLSPGGAVVTTPVTTYNVGANSGYAANLVATYGITSATAFTRTISHPRGITIDSSGNAWLGDSNGSAAVTTSPISGGTFVCPSTTNETCDFGTVAEFPAATAAGTAGTGGATGYYSPSFPYVAAADSKGNVYFNLAGGSVTYGSKIIGEFNASGAFTSGGALSTNPYAIAIDNNTAATNGPYVWAASGQGCASTVTVTGDAGIIEEYGTGALATTTTYTGVSGTGICTSSSGIRDAIAAQTGVIQGIGFDGSNNIWMANAAYELGGGTAGSGAPNTVTYGIVSLNSNKEVIEGVTVACPAGSTCSLTTTNPGSDTAMGAGGLLDPQYLAVDGAGNAWVSNYNTPAVSEFSVNGETPATFTAINTLSGTNGFVHNETGSKLTLSEGIGIDLSGNVWVANYASGTNYVTVIVGAAVPVGPPIPGGLGVAP